MDFKRTTAINRMMQLRKRIRIVPGGTSAGKTFGIIPLLIDLCAKSPGLRVSIVSATLPHLKKGALRDFKTIMRATLRWRDKGWHGTDYTYTFANGAYIEFFSADDEAKARGPRRDVLYCNEANSLKFETFHQLLIRTQSTIWLDFNPSAKFWAHLHYSDDPAAEWLTLTYKDNEALDPNTVEEIEKAQFRGFHDHTLPDLFHKSNIKDGFWSNWWKVYGLGQTGGIRGAVWSDWLIDWDIVLDGLRPLCRWLDFGFVNDPAASGSIWKHRGQLWVKESFYETGLTNTINPAKLHQPSLEQRFNEHGYDAQDMIAADAAEAKSITELRDRNFDVYPVPKDEIVVGITRVKKWVVNIHPESKNIISEKENYTWKEDSLTGNFKNDPIEKYNHHSDGIRYAVKHLEMHGII